MKHIMIDAGHGGKDPGAVGTMGTKEKDVALTIAKKVGDKLGTKGYKVSYTRTGDTFVELTKRAGLANKAQVNCFISIHINNYKDLKANGTETYTYTKEDQATNDLAKSVQEELVKGISLKNRGVKQENYLVLRETTMPAVLVEVAFISNADEEIALRDTLFVEKASTGIANGVIKWLGGVVANTEAPKPEEKLTAIVGTTIATKTQMIAYLNKVNPSPKLPSCTADELIDQFIREGNAEGIRGDIAFCQALKETGNFNFGNIVKPEQHNYSGLGALNDNKEGEAESFESPQIGVRAQIQHLKAYATILNLNRECVDPRYHLVIRGSAKYVEHLGAGDNPNKTGWCYPGHGYGKDILKILGEVLKMVDKKEHWGQPAVDQMKKDGYITSDKDPAQNVTWAEFATVVNRITEEQKTMRVDVK